ncbi:Cytochrome P450 71B7 [Raphanus sativus]|nr:Cytochrome P450 71B7 [Raphanus sativus]
MAVLQSFNQKSHSLFRGLCQKYGPVMLIRFGMESMDILVISSKEAAEEYHEGCSRPETVGSHLFSYNCEDSGSAPSGEREEWETSRYRTMIKLLNTKTQSFRYIREREIDLFVKKLSECAARRSPVNLTKTLFTLVSNMTFRVLSGQNLQECKFIDDDSIAELVKRFDMITEYFSFPEMLPYGFGWLIDRIWGPSKRSRKAFSELRTFFESILDDRLNSGEMVLENMDIIDLMIDMIRKQEKDIDSIKLTTEYLKTIITEMFLAQVNTSVTALVWAMAELIGNPRVMKQVQDEIRTTLGDKKERITEDDLDQLHYLKLVVKETFRLHPSVPVLPPSGASRDKIQGYDIPKEALIMINVYGIARDPKVWTDPDEFNPDRFSNSSLDYKGLEFELLPVGSGKIICPEMRMATVELALVNLLYFFDWGLPHGKRAKDMDLEETGIITLSKKTALDLVPVLHH